MSENINEVEIHGCIICARLFIVLAVYTPDGKLVDSSVNSPGGHSLPNKGQVLVACDTHTVEHIESATKRWLSRNDKELAEEQDKIHNGAQWKWTSRIIIRY
jgi:hypothetical protein